MRLWHTNLIKYLPKQQLLGLWRELNSIYAKEDKHILINFIYEYKKFDLCDYSCFVIDEFRKRGYKINLERFENYFSIADRIIKEPYYKPFYYHMNEEYLKICCWNLYEKYIRGQQGFTDEAIKFIKKQIGVK